MLAMSIPVVLVLGMLMSTQQSCSPNLVSSNEGEDTSGRADGPRLFISIPALRIKVRDAGKYAEVYVEHWVVDGSTDSDGDEIETTEAEPAQVITSGVFRRIRENCRDYLPLSGEGVVLYPGRDPGGYLEINLAIMERDRRNAPAATKEAAKHIENSVPKVISSVLQAGSLGAASADATFRFITDIYRRYRKDDYLLTLVHSERQAHYGLKNGEPKTIRFCNGNVAGLLRICGEIDGKPVDCSEPRVQPITMESCKPFESQWWNGAKFKPLETKCESAKG